MTDKSISPLRRPFIENMTVRGFTPPTQRGDLRAVADSMALFARPPDEAGAEHLRRFQVHMRSSGATATTMNAPVSALQAHQHRRLPIEPQHCIGCRRQACGNPSQQWTNGPPAPSSAGH